MTAADGRPPAGARRPPALAAAVCLGALLVVTTASVVRQWPQPGAAAQPPRSGAPRAATAAPAPAARTAAAHPSYLPDPRHRMLLGAYTDLAGERSAEAAVEQREAAMGRRYDLETIYCDWASSLATAGIGTVIAHRRTPLVVWFGPGKSRTGHATLKQVTDGRDDAWIRRQAKAVRDLGHRVYLSLMPEMNGSWYPGYSRDPAAFVTAWRRVHGLFAHAGVHNVTWVWAPNLSPGDWDRYYPGGAYVDVIGLSGYNGWGNRKPPAQLFGPFLTHYAGRKPLMIAETGTDSGPIPAATWITEMHSYLRDVAGPDYGVIAVCWFDADPSPYAWRLDQTPAAWQAWLALARDPYFGA